MDLLYASLHLLLDNRENKNSRNVCLSQIRKNIFPRKFLLIQYYSCFKNKMNLPVLSQNSFTSSQENFFPIHILIIHWQLTIVIDIQVTLSNCTNHYQIGSYASFFRKTCQCQIKKTHTPVDDVLLTCEN